MADRKPALYYALVVGYHPTLPGRIMAVTSEASKPDYAGRRMVFGRDEDHGTATRRAGIDVIHRFKDWAEVEAFEEACREAEEAVREKHAKVLRAHEHHRTMMLKYDRAKSEALDEVHEAKRTILEKLKEQAA